ncbi:hypothetical protein EV401DRAFT_837751 [Pisolithus croceorrhizus]|nr:hypothetical protein EV401DRAFT_837751 [Pisolithus croceorrhizus]
MLANSGTTFHPTTPPLGRTFANQDKLPKLPIPPLEDTCKRYLKALPWNCKTTVNMLQTTSCRTTLPRRRRPSTSGASDRVGSESSKLYRGLLVRFLILPWVSAEADHRRRVDRSGTTPADRGSQLPRAAALIISSLGFIHDLRHDC